MLSILSKIRSASVESSPSLKCKCPASHLDAVPRNRTMVCKELMRRVVLHVIHAPVGHVRSYLVMNSPSKSVMKTLQRAVFG